MTTLKKEKLESKMKERIQGKSIPCGADSSPTIPYYISEEGENAAEKSKIKTSGKSTR